jgi:hypothetical protein
MRAMVARVADVSEPGIRSYLPTEDPADIRTLEALERRGLLELDRACGYAWPHFVAAPALWNHVAPAAPPEVSSFT